MMHTSPAPGLWAYSLDPTSSDDISQCADFYDTKDEAVAACRLDLKGIWNDEPRAYVVRVDKVLTYDLCAKWLAKQVVHAMEHGEMSEDEELGLEKPVFSKVLDRTEEWLLVGLIAWLETHSLVPSVGWWQYNDIEAVERQPNGEDDGA